MSEEEIERLLMATPDLRYRTSMTLTYACGLRISEIVAITIDDVKSKEGLLHIRRWQRRHLKRHRLQPLGQPWHCS